MTTPLATGAAVMSVATATMAQGQIHTTLYLADPQLEHLGPRSCVDNPLVDKIIPSADRNLISTATAPLFIDTLLHHVRRFHDAQSLQVLGDVADTPCKDEITHLEKVLERHPVPVDGYDRGNHSSSNAYGVVNILSRAYRFLTKIFRHDPLKEDVCQSCGGADNLLTPQATFRGMHRILHRHHPSPPPIESINTAVKRADAKSYVPRDTGVPVAFTPDNARQTFETFWKPTAAVDGRVRYWEALVNFQESDLPVGKRPSKVTPFYIQATEGTRFILDDGSEVPVYTISMDSQDTSNPVAVIPGVSALQIRLVQNFIDQKLKENPNARFKLSSHFAGERVLKGDTSCAARELFKNLLSREEVVLFTGGHSHDRQVHNLTQELKLKRTTPLMEIVVPSLIDFHPSQNQTTKMYEDARALVIETMTVDKNAEGQPVLKIDLEYQGLDREDIKDDFMPLVEERLAWFKKNHGYQRSQDTIGELKGNHIRGFLKRRLKRMGQFFTVGLPPLALPFLFAVPAVRSGFRQFWARTFSPVQAVIDNFTVVSTVQMFNECRHFLPFLESIAHFMKLDAEPGEAAAQAQIEGIMNTLKSEYETRRPAFEKAVAEGTSAAELKKYADLYQRADLHVLPELLLSLKYGGRARAFAVLAGLDASQQEYEWQDGKPATVPNKVPVISVRVGV